MAYGNQEATNTYASIITAEDVVNLRLNVEVPSNIPALNHAFIVLGYALSKDGEMQKDLLERLLVAKEAADANKNSMIIVSGGIPKNGKTEADVMFDWLKENGIDENRIIKEDQSRDTVGNALHSMKICRRGRI